MFRNKPVRPVIQTAETSSIAAGRGALSCTVIVCTRNRPVQLSQCLNALNHQTHPGFEILVVDNSVGDEQSQIIAEQWGARYFIEPVAGLSRARNCGVQHCNTDIVAFLDDDSIPDSEWLSGLISEFTKPEVMVVTGRILPFRKSSGSPLPGYGCPDVGPQRLEVDRQTPFWFEIASFGGLGGGASMAFRRQAFRVWPGFEERLGRGSFLSGGEESYAFFSLIDRGYKVIYSPHSVQYHPCPQSQEELRARYSNDLSLAAGYFLFLFFEEPRYRRAILRYILQAIAGTPRTWRNAPVTVRYSLPSGWSRLAAYLRGVGCYFRSQSLSASFRGILSLIPLVRDFRATSSTSRPYKTRMLDISNSPASD